MKMSLAEGREKITILRLMVVTAALAVMIRGFVEAPREFAWDRSSRIIDRSMMLQDIAKKEDARARLSEAWDYPPLAENQRKKTEELRRALRVKPPDPIGHVCFLITLFTIPLLIAVIIVRGVIRWRRRCDPAC
jgi:hypothetical protein